jgi:hypothetical protein
MTQATKDAHQAFSLPESSVVENLAVWKYSRIRLSASLPGASRVPTSASAVRIQGAEYYAQDQTI